MKDRPPASAVHAFQLRLDPGLGLDAAPTPPTPAIDRPPTPRDSQRSRVYRAESAVTDTNLSALAACGDEMERVAASTWWADRFPDLTDGRLPRLRPGNGARRAFYRPEPEPSITLPRRYRLLGVLLHEMTHWALDGTIGVADHGPTFTRVLLDATAEFTGTPRANALARSYRDHGVKVGAVGRVDGFGRVRYGWDERLERRRHQGVSVVTEDPDPLTGVFLGWARGKLAIRLELPNGERTSVPVAGLLDVEIPHDSPARGTTP
ncbi:MAG: hypothetical protein R3A49_01205 [Acidimicrobiia bacterium]